MDGAQAIEKAPAAFVVAVPHEGVGTMLAPDTGWPVAALTTAPVSVPNSDRAIGPVSAAWPATTVTGPAAPVTQPGFDTLIV